jgi:hypothetical protein
MLAMAWMHWGDEGERRYGPRPKWKGWAGKIDIRRVTSPGLDLLILNDVLLSPQAVFTVVGEGGEPDATVAFEVHPPPLHAPGDPYLRVHEVKDARPEVIGIHIAAKPGGRGITTADLRSFALDELTTDVFTVVGVPMFNAEEFAATPQDYLEKDYRHIGRTMREARQGSRGTVTRAELQEVARVYRQHIDTTPIQAVRSAGGYKSDRTAARRVQQARAAGLLPKTTPGKRKG